ncbi:PadR family transcriptional regulator [Gordonia sp. NPDC058843]|uniref:PadR family transcriptional regulator n=1 Tax=unclassified Gordonia (in: high G+C Gram-positive bacteria) TaxID=2657482 RepID=UPI003645C516
MPSVAAASLVSLLNDLAERTRDQSKEPDLRPAIGLVYDLGRLVAAGAEADIRLAQAAVAGAREQLEVGDHAINTPEKALLGKERQAYLAGALWAINELMTVRLEQLGTAFISGGLTRRGQIRALVLSNVAVDETLSPSELKKRIADNGTDVRLDEISRALGDLFNEGLVAPSQPGPGSDRRRKYFALTAEGRRTVAQVDE